MRRLMHMREGSVACSTLRSELPQPKPDRLRRKRRAYRPTEIAYIKSRRRELILTGLTDSEASREIAQEIGSTPAAVNELFRRLMEKGQMKENPNKVEAFSDNDIEHIRRRRPELIGQKMNEKQIARVLCLELGRMMSSVYDKIRGMVKAGELPPNPWKVQRKAFRKEEVRTLRRMREELIEAGDNDVAISEAIAKALGREPSSVENKIRNMVKAKKLPKNPNNNERKDYSKAKIEFRRKRGIKQGLNDTEISRYIAEKSGMDAEEVYDVIFTRVTNGKLPKNPNNLGAFSQLELRKLTRRREQLIGLGLNDTSISRVLSPEMGKRTPYSIRGVMDRLRRDGEIGPNPNRSVKQSREMEFIITEREAAMEGGASDMDAAKLIAPQIGRMPGTVKILIMRAVEIGGFRPNPN